MTKAGEMTTGLGDNGSSVQKGCSVFEAVIAFGNLRYTKIYRIEVSIFLYYRLDSIDL